MVLPPGEAEGDSSNRHRGADQWLFVLSGIGHALLRTLNFYVPPAYTKAGNERSAGKR